jgi:hypothetical protein
MVILLHQKTNVELAHYLSAMHIVYILARDEIHSKSKSKLYYNRLSVIQSILVPGAHLGPATNFSLSSLFIFRQLRIC